MAHTFLFPKGYRGVLRWNVGTRVVLPQNSTNQGRARAKSGHFLNRGEKGWEWLKMS
jgi:hypothetical protein